MSNARNLSKFKPSSSGLVETADIADDAITNAKVADDAIDTAQIADNAVANAQMADNAVGTNEIADDAVTTAKVNPTQTDITSVGTLSGLNVRNSSTTGPTVNIGTTSTSVADGGYIGGIMFDASTANSGTARIQALSNGQTDAGNTGTGADIAFECRENNQSFTEKARLHGAGQFTVNNQPYFMGGRQGTTGSVTGYTEGTGNVMICNISQDNTGGHYNTSNGQFTCPVTGQYAVNFFGFMHSGSGVPTSNYSIQIMLNASIMQIPYFAHVQGNNTYMSASTIIRCASTNVITIKLMNGLWYSNDWRYFHNSFYLLG